VAGAIVTLAGAGLSAATGGLRILTDNEGQFVFRGLPNGSLMMNATKGGYLPGAFGRRTPGGPAQPLELADGQRIGDATLIIWRVAAITGAIVDEAGEPVVGIEVRAYRRTSVSGRRALRQEAQSLTDDRGVYRLFNLTPGQYVVGVAMTTVAVPSDALSTYQPGSQTDAAMREAMVREMAGISALGMTGAGSLRVGNLVVNPRGRMVFPPSNDGRTFAYPTTFYPAATASAQASLVTIGSGEERSNIDIQMKPAPTNERFRCGDGARGTRAVRRHAARAVRRGVHGHGARNVEHDERQFRRLPVHQRHTGPVHPEGRQTAATRTQPA
jgi:hypothetical protein